MFAYLPAAHPCHHGPHGLVIDKGALAQNRRYPLSAGLAPNALWCTDYKGSSCSEIKDIATPDRFRSRQPLPLALRGHESIKNRALLLPLSLFKERGLPQPFVPTMACPSPSNGLFNLSRLAVCGCGSALPSRESSRPSATERPMNACIEP